MSYADLTEIRTKDIDGLTDWLWIKQDGAAWTWPQHDWIHEHRIKWFKHVQQFRVCVQAGGNQGMYPRLLAQKFEHVYTFEPDPLNFHCLVNNCQQDNIIKMQAALGDCNRMIRVERFGMGNTGAHKVSHDGITCIPQLTLDSLNLNSCDLLCLDVEYYELYALKGAQATICKHLPVVTAERATSECHELLRQWGYVHVDTSAEDHVFVHQTKKTD
jgi:FkbM family methyltransferase